jgi:hypothetical protein
MRNLAFLLLPLLFLFAACTEGILPHIQDASNKRDTICAFVEVWAEDRPELDEVYLLCAADASLKEIAAAYAGCSEPGMGGAEGEASE